MKRCIRQELWCAAALMTLAWSQGRVQADWISTISSSKPIHWFRFEELSGSTADDQGSANFDGWYIGGVGLGKPGLVGHAAAFDGGSHVFIAGANLSADWTLESIFSADTVSGSSSMGLIGADFAASADRMAIKAEQWNSTGQMGYTLFGVVDVWFTDPLAATPADFTHVVFVGESSGVSLYVNGALVGSATTSTSLSRFALGTAAIRADGTTVDPLTGLIDELVIYDRALSAKEISAHFNAVPGPSGVPDAGDTSLLLGFALAGLALLRSRVC